MNLGSGTVSITVEGAGGVINFEVYVIKAALEAYGVKVILQNDAPEKDPKEFVEEIARRIRGEWSMKPIEKRVVIFANHIPWGG